MIAHKSKHVRPKIPTPLRGPMPGDEHMLRNIIGRYHVSKPDEDVKQDILRRLRRSMARNNLTMSDEVRELWMAKALEIHHANRDLYNAVQSGYVV